MAYFIRKLSRGFTLLEVAFAIGVITVGMTGVSSLVILNIQAENINKNYLLASMLAQEGLELVRNKRDANWLIAGNNWKTGAGLGSDSDIVQDGTYAIDHTGNIYDIDAITENGARLNIQGNFYEHGGGVQTPFSRLITVTDNGEWVEVEAKVRWYNRGKASEYVATTYLYDWR